ncbi:Leucine aminopeptidase 1 [Haplosporangium sp. Z 767]|nr:Leucine aminopeptidase 1 [Haplosporangium sp. Z 767]
MAAAMGHGQSRGYRSHDCRSRKRSASCADPKDKAPVRMSEKQRLNMLKKKIGHMDVTDYQDFRPLHLHLRREKFTRYVHLLSTANMKISLTTFKIRYYKSDSGLEAAQWLHRQISDLIENSVANSDISLRKFTYEKWKQFTVIDNNNANPFYTRCSDFNGQLPDKSILPATAVARFEGKDESLYISPIIIGAHLESVNAWFLALARSPGADDDGSGTVTTLEVFRSLINIGYHPVRSIEFHWYSAEEAGLLGSQDVAEDYRCKSVENDMIGYVGFRFKESFGIVTDNVNRELTELVKARLGPCIVGQVRVQSCAAIEGDFSDISPFIHGDGDSVTHINFGHMRQFAKLTLGFTIELG